MAMLFRTSDSSAYVAQRFVPLSVPLFILVFLSSCEAAGAESATFLAAREKYDRREYLAAMADAQKAVAEDENHAAYRHLYGKTLLALKQFTDAELQLRKALQLDSKKAEYHYSLATLLLEQRNIAEDEYAAMGLRGGTVKTGREKEVAEVLSRTVELDPSHLKARLHLGRTYFDLGKFDLSEAQFRAILQQDPGFQWAHYHLAVLWLSRGAVGKAIREYEKEAELFPNNAQTRFELGELLLKSGAVGSALVHLTAANQADSLLPDVHFALAKAYRDSGNPQQAIREANRCLELDRRFPDAHYLLSSLYRAVGNQEKARQHSQMFEKLKGEIKQLEDKFRKDAPAVDK